MTGAQHWRTPGEPRKSLRQATLANWRRDAEEGVRPAIVFNSTVVETGERFLVSTADLRRASGQLLSAQGRKIFSELYGDRDLDVVTAARLSATFPYVTPAARIWQRDVFAKAYHVADGGYYDNYGIVSLLDWLEVRSRQAAPYPSKVIIVPQSHLNPCFKMALEITIPPTP